MYLLIRTNPARKPYSIEVNCSNTPSVGFDTSPSHTLPTLILSGLLFRSPRGIILVFAIEEHIEFMQIIFKSEDGACK